MVKIAVIGAGLGGLIAARLLNNLADVSVFEKARGVGGRMSTRRSEPYFFDHGAQYFTVQSDLFQSFIDPLIARGVIENWKPRCVHLDGAQIVERRKNVADELYYVGVPGMNSVAKFLAKDLSISLNTKITKLEHDIKWNMTDETGRVYNGFDWVISSIPAPQAADLIPQKFKYYKDISRTEMRGCYALMLGFEHSLSLGFDAAHVMNSDLSWIAVNNHKPRRSGAVSLIVHSSEDYADTHIEDDRMDVMRHMVTETSRVLGQDIDCADYKTIHLWRYAKAGLADHIDQILLDDESKLAVCGDWCVGTGVEDAFTSAYNLANKIKELVL